eukprot:21135-Eustigmatos_ZCMA.PRE.1
MLPLRIELPLEEGAVVKDYRVHPYRNAVHFEDWHISIYSSRTVWDASDMLGGRHHFNDECNAGHAILTYQGSLCGNVEIVCENNLGLELATV